MIRVEPSNQTETVLILGDHNHHNLETALPDLGFIIMPQHEQARSAMAVLNGQKLHGRNLRVEKEKKRLVQRGGSRRHKG